MTFAIGIPFFIHRLRLQTPPPQAINGQTFIGISQVRIEISSSLPYYQFVTQQGLLMGGIVNLASPIQGRYVKLTVFPKTGSGAGDPSTQVGVATDALFSVCGLIYGFFLSIIESPSLGEAF